MKFEIELTEDQVKDIRANGVLGQICKISDQIRSKLPPKQKRWRFYKGNFSSREELHNPPDGFIVFSVHRDGNHGEPAYCFTKEQLGEALAWAYFRYGDASKASSYHEAVDSLLEDFLSNQEVKE